MVIKKIKMKLLELKNKKNFKLIKLNEKSNFLVKIIAFNSFIPPSFRIYTLQTFISKKSSKKHSKTIIVNRCVFSAYKKRLNKLISLSRHLLLKFARQGLIYGLYRLVW
jgi:ribosomal protein S14